MVIIREQQFHVFSQASSQAFEDRTYAHLLEYFPRQCALLGEPAMREAIRFGRSKAEGYALTVEPCIRSYIDLMCILGGRFDTNPLLPWAADILTDRRGSSQIARGDLLYDRAWEYIQSIVPDYRDATGRPTTARFVAELRKLRNLPDNLLSDACVPVFARGWIAWVRSVFPAKYRYVGPEAVERLAGAAVQTARRYGILGVRGTSIIAMFMFVLGRDFDRDPLIPWASSTLNRQDVPGADRADRLCCEGVHFLRRWWDLAPREEA